MRIALIVTLSAIPVAPLSLAAQASYPVKTCIAPLEPLGVMHAEGVVRFTVNNVGRTDTASIEILAVRGMSAAGFRSASRRQLSACRFDRSRDMVEGDKRVVTAMRFDSATTVVTPASMATGTEAVLPVGPPLRLPADPVDATDSTLEERPRRLSCPQPPDPPMFLGSFRTRQDRDAAYEEYLRRNSGTATANLTVGFSGHVIPEGVVIKTSSNPGLRDIFLAVFSRCEFVPGRIGGVTVTTIVATTAGIGNRGVLP